MYTRDKRKHVVTELELLPLKTYKPKRLIVRQHIQLVTTVSCHSNCCVRQFLADTDTPYYGNMSQTLDSGSWVHIKVRQSRYRLGQALRAVRFWGFRISRQSETLLAPRTGRFYASEDNRVGWIKIDQLDGTCFIISLITAQHVSNVSTSIFRSLRLIVDLFHVLYCSGSMCVGVTVWFGWGGVSLCRLQPA